MLRFGGYLLWVHIVSDWSRNNKYSRNFLWCSRFYGKDCKGKIEGVSNRFFCGYRNLVPKRVLLLVHQCLGVRDILIGSLSKGVFERLTANEASPLFTLLGATTFGILSVLIHLKIRAHLLSKNEKRPFLVAVLAQKRLCLSSLL